MKTFGPTGDDTVLLSATAVSARAALDPSNSVVRLYNAGPDTAYVVFGNAGIAATTAKMPMPSGSVETFSKGPATNVAAICDSGKSAALYFTVGEGG